MIHASSRGGAYTDNKYIVYMHTNKINGKIYIGITKQSPEKRWQSGYGYRHSPHFYNAIVKYGWKQFDHEILAEGLSKPDACDIEKMLIKELNTTNRKWGYNVEEGGTAPSMSEETRRKVSLAQKGIPRYYLIGTHRSEETKKRISDAQKGKPRVMSGIKHPNSKPILCVQTGNIYFSITEAQKQTGVSLKSISNCLTGRSHSAGGFTWMYVS